MHQNASWNNNNASNAMLDQTEMAECVEIKARSKVTEINFFESN